MLQVAHPQRGISSIHHSIWVGFSCVFHSPLHFPATPNSSLHRRFARSVRDWIQHMHLSLLQSGLKIRRVHRLEIRRQKGMVFYMLRKGSRSRLINKYQQIYMPSINGSFRKSLWFVVFWPHQNVHKDKAYDIILDGNGWLMLSMWGLVF